jgi:hypothetical protein
MKHIPTFEQFITESYNRTQTKYKTQNVEWDDVAPGDYIADGPNVGEVSRVIGNTKKGFTLKRVWNNVRKKDGEEFFVPHDLDAMKEHPKSIIKVINYVNESEDLDEGKAPANDATIKLHINTYSSSEDPFDVATDIGKRYNWSDKEIEKAEAIIRKNYIK